LVIKGFYHYFKRPDNKKEWQIKNNLAIFTKYFQSRKKINSFSIFFHLFLQLIIRRKSFSMKRFRLNRKNQIVNPFSDLLSLFLLLDFFHA